MSSEYETTGLSESEAHPDPIAQFDVWFREAVAAGVTQPNAMALATAAADGTPSVRYVLLKGYDECGFVFYTNYASRKGRELAANPAAALAIVWLDLHRQVRVEGFVERLSAAESDAYFESRPRRARLAASISHQSRVIGERKELESAFAELATRLDGQVIPRPPEWGGFRLQPSLVEFWQGRRDRLHDRIEYRRIDDRWRTSRLAP